MQERGDELSLVTDQQIGAATRTTSQLRLWELLLPLPRETNSQIRLLSPQATPRVGFTTRSIHATIGLK
jgi:hypothetical protein